MNQTAPLTLVVATVVVALAPVGGPEEAPPLKTEDVVRMLVSGMAVESVLTEIRSRAVEFDLSEDMIDELRIAGVPDSVIEAMRERQRELHPAPDPVAEPGEAEELVTTAPVLVIRIENADTQDGRPAAVYFPGRLPPAAAQALQVGDGTEPVEVEELALYVACRTAVHVPDYWRSKSPLGRDFISMPRHRVVAFHRGDTRVARRDLPKGVAARLPAAPRGVDYVSLELPGSLEARLEFRELHDLSVGVAIEVAGRFLRIVSEDRDDVELAEDAPLRVRIANDRSDAGFGITAAFVD